MKSRSWWLSIIITTIIIITVIIITIIIGGITIGITTTTERKAAGARA